MKNYVKHFAITLVLLMTVGQVSFSPVYGDETNEETCTCINDVCTDSNDTECTVTESEDENIMEEKTEEETVAEEEIIMEEDETNNNDEEDATEESTENEDTENIMEESTTGEEEENNNEEDANLSEDITTENVVDVVSDDIDDVSDKTAEELIDQAVDQLIEELDDMSDDEAANAVEKVQKRIEAKIAAINELIKENPKLRGKLERKIRHLKNLLNRFRAKAIRKNRKILSITKTVQNRPAIYTISWGNLNNKRPCLKTVKRADVIRALKNGETPEGCGRESVSYEGKISVDSGTLKIQRKVLFEKNDAITTEEGKEIAFSSIINGHWDGLIVEYTPEENAEKEVSMSISIGDLSGTYTGSDIIGRKDIGNDHVFQIRKVGNIIAGLTKANQEKLLAQKLKIQDRINAFRDRIYRLKLLNAGGDSLDDIEEIIDETEEYNFDETSTTEVQSEINTALNELDDDVSDSTTAAIAERLRKRIQEIKEKAKNRKFQQNLIPFKDTDDTEWYTQYIGPIKSRGIISGYRDANGNELGEFRPANNITVAEILKIGLETAGQGQSTSGEPKMTAAQHHWAKGYVKKAEELGLNIVADNNTDLNRPATRAEVVRMILEALGITPDAITTTSFSDVGITHPHAAFIEYAKALGVISGDAGKTTFRPDDPINRAEAAKIANQIIENVMGEDVSE